MFKEWCEPSGSGRWRENWFSLMKLSKLLGSRIWLWTRIKAKKFPVFHFFFICLYFGLVVGENTQIWFPCQVVRFPTISYVFLYLKKSKFPSKWLNLPAVTLPNCPLFPTMSMRWGKIQTCITILSLGGRRSVKSWQNTFQYGIKCILIVTSSKRHSSPTEKRFPTIWFSVVLISSQQYMVSFRVLCWRYRVF